MAIKLATPVGWRQRITPTPPADAIWDFQTRWQKRGPSIPVARKTTTPIVALGHGGYGTKLDLEQDPHYLQWRAGHRADHPGWSFPASSA